MKPSLVSANDLLATHAALTARVRASQQEHRRILSNLPSPPQSLLSLPLLPSPPPSPPDSPSLATTSSSSKTLHELLPYQRIVRPDLPPPKRARVARYANYVPEEETIRNDYSQRYVDGGEWPQDWVQGAEPERRFEEYPKQQRLLALKKAAVAEASNGPMHLPYSSLSALLPTKFDVILIDPPFSSSFSWDTLQSLPIPSLAADPSFVLLWVGSGAGEGLEKGREVLAKWGYRRCEDVVWIKTNKHSNAGPGTDPPTTSLLTRTKQHCLMGIRGTVRRSTDSWFVHCNVDTDVILWEGDPTDPTRKPPEMYTLIENFCLGTRRLEIFGRNYSLRPGWVTAGDFELSDKDVQNTGARPWNKDIWDSEVRLEGGRTVVPSTQEIENLRPKSPVRGGGGGGGGGQSSGSVNQSPAMSQLSGPMGGMGMQNLPARPSHLSSPMISVVGGMNLPPAFNSGPSNSGGAISGGVGLGVSHHTQRPPQFQPQHHQQPFHQQRNNGPNMNMGGMHHGGMGLGLQTPMQGMSNMTMPMGMDMGMHNPQGMMMMPPGNPGYAGYMPQQGFTAGVSDMSHMMGMGVPMGMQPMPMNMGMGMGGMNANMPMGGWDGSGMNPQAAPFVPGALQNNMAFANRGQGAGGFYPPNQGGWSG